MASAAHAGAGTDGKLVMALDQGTTSSRAIIFQEDGTIVSVAQRPVTPTYPHPGWVNQDATQLWETTLKVAQVALKQAQLSAEQIAAIGITNQRETTILWDRASGEPVAPAISWQSRQTAPLIEAIRQRGMAAAYQHITGLVPDAYFSATKIAALLDAYPDLRHRAEAGEIAFGTVDSWLIWNLSGGKVHATDVTNASRTMLYDLRKLDWSDELLRDLNIPREILPTVLPSAGLFCETDPSLLGATIPVTGVAGDQQSALFGQACSEPGEAKNTYGTGSFVLLQTGDTPRPSARQLLTTIAWQLGPEAPVQYALEGSIFVTGAAIQWLRDGLGIIQKASEVEALASSVPDTHGVVFVPALTGLGAPHWDPDARGTIVGITRGTTAAHIARAAVEAIAFQTRDVVDAMTADAGVPLTELRVDGGASQNDLLMQFQADILGVPVVRPTITETTALGAAALARVGAGIADLDAHRSTMRANTDRVFEPTMSQDERDSRYAIWLRAVERAKGWGQDL